LGFYYSHSASHALASCWPKNLFSRPNPPGPLTLDASTAQAASPDPDSARARRQARPTLAAWHAPADGARRSDGRRPAERRCQAARRVSASAGRGSRATLPQQSASSRAAAEAPGRAAARGTPSGAPAQRRQRASVQADWTAFG
jgi:hypothetical protein